jgi:hypothetical protein
MAGDKLKTVMTQTKSHALSDLLATLLGVYATFPKAESGPSTASASAPTSAPVSASATPVPSASASRLKESVLRYDAYASPTPAGSAKRDTHTPRGRLLEPLLQETSGEVDEVDMLGLRLQGRTALL